MHTLVPSFRLHTGAMSMGAGEYISVSSQRDTEAADVDKERAEQKKGPASRARNLDELIQIYMDRGLTYDLARQASHCRWAHTRSSI